MKDKFPLDWMLLLYFIFLNFEITQCFIFLFLFYLFLLYQINLRQNLDSFFVLLLRLWVLLITFITLMQLSISIHIPLSISLIILILLLILHLCVSSFLSFILFVTFFLSPSITLIKPSIQPFFLTFLSHIILFFFSLHFQFKSFKLLIFYIILPYKNTNNKYYVCSLTSNCFVSSFFTANSNASFAFPL